MANKSFVIQYLIKARDGFSREAKKVSKGLHDIEKKTHAVNRANRSLNKSMIGGMKRMGAAAISFGAVMAGAFGASKVLSVGQEFQDSMLDLGAITGATGKDFEFLESKARSLAKTSVTSQAEVAKGMELVASAKPELLENLPLLSKTTEQILLLKNASGMQFADASRIGAESLNIFGKSAESTAEFVNILAAGSKFGSSLIGESGEAVVLAGGSARNAGLGFLDLNAAIQVAAKGGFKGARAGTALNSIFGRLSRKGADFEKDGLEGVFTKIKLKMDSMTSATQRSLYASELFGEEHSKVGFAILNNVKDLTRFQSILKGTNVAQEQADRRMASFSTKVRAMSIIINEKLIDAFTRLEPTMEKYLTQAGAFVESIDSEDMDNFVTGVKGMVDVVTRLGNGLAKVANLLNTIENFSSEWLLPYKLLTDPQKLLQDTKGFFGFGDDGEKQREMKETGWQMMRDTETLRTPADNFRQSIDVGVNVGLDQGLKQTGETMVSPLRRGSANVGMTTNPA